MADIGDMQSVSGDFSTFSGHLVVCREMLTHAQSYEGQSLVLLDEIGTGTDPAQGIFTCIYICKSKTLLGICIRLHVYRNTYAYILLPHLTLLNIL
jgi:hypothetical protein